MFSLGFGAQAEPHWIIAQRGQARGHRHITDITAFEPPSSHKSEKSKVSERQRLRGKFRWAECRRIEDGTLLAFLVRTAPSWLLGLSRCPKLGSAIAAAGTDVALPERCPLGGNYFVLAPTKSVDNEPLRLESQHSFYHARTSAHSLRAYK